MPSPFDHAIASAFKHAVGSAFKHLGPLAGAGETDWRDVFGFSATIEVRLKIWLMYDLWTYIGPPGPSTSDGAYVWEVLDEVVLTSAVFSHAGLRTMLEGFFFPRSGLATVWETVKDVAFDVGDYAGAGYTAPSDQYAPSFFETANGVDSNGRTVTTAATPSGNGVTFTAEQDTPEDAYGFAPPGGVWVHPPVGGEGPPEGIICRVDSSPAGNQYIAGLAGTFPDQDDYYATQQAELVIGGRRWINMQEQWSVSIRLEESSEGVIV